MGHGVANETPSYGWRRPGKEGAHTARAALALLTYQAESGTSCPLTMTYAVVPTLKNDPFLKEW